MKLDNYDKKLLTLLQKDNRIPQRELAEQVNLSVSAVNRRISYLMSQGVITCNVSLIDPIKVGRPITIIVEVKIENEQLNLLNKHKKIFLNCPQIQQIYYVTGEFDFLLVFNVKDMIEYETLSQQLFFSNDNIKSFKTLVVMQCVKQQLTVLVE